MPPWQNDAALHQLLLSFSGVLPLRKASNLIDTRVRKRILGLTEGVMVRICRLVEAAAVHAIESEQERIDLELLNDDFTAETLVSISDRRGRRSAT
jgi:hypothetical protein